MAGHRDAEAGRRGRLGCDIRIRDMGQLGRRGKTHQGDHHRILPVAAARRTVLRIRGIRPLVHRILVLAQHMDLDRATGQTATAGAPGPDALGQWAVMPRKLLLLLLLLLLPHWRDWRR